MSMRARVVAVMIATLALLLTSCGESDVAQVPEGEGQTQTAPDVAATQPAEEQGEATGDVNVLNQIGDGTTVVLSRVSTDDATRALIVIHDDAEGAPGEPLGFAEVTAAAEGNLTVDLDEPLEAGSHRLWAVMHVDAEPVGEFEPGVDEVMTTAGDPVQDEFSYTVTTS